MVTISKQNLYSYDLAFKSITLDNKFPIKCSIAKVFLSMYNKCKKIIHLAVFLHKTDIPMSALKLTCL